MSYCILCGNELVDGTCSNAHDFKKMCLNCTSCSVEDENYFCQNAENSKEAVEKIKNAAIEAAGGYEVETLNIELKPLALKKPTAKCKRWELNNEVLTKIAESFK